MQFQVWFKEPDGGTKWMLMAILPDREQADECVGFWRALFPTRAYEVRESGDENPQTTVDSLPEETSDPP